MSVEILTKEQQAEWDNLILSTKRELILHMGELLEQIEASRSVAISMEMETNIRIVGDLLRDYSDRSDEAKQALFDPVVNQMAELAIDMFESKNSLKQ